MGTSPTTGARTAGTARTETLGTGNGHTSRHTTERRSTETKAAPKTTEFVAYLAVLAGILISALVADNDGPGGFGAQEAWLYATILTFGYMVSRGLAKSGSRDPYTHDRGDH